MRPFIGIPCGTFRDKDWCPPAFGHRQTYIDAIVAAGGVPLLIPLVEDEEVLRALYARLDGLLLAGGRDIEPGFYGEQPIPEIGEIDRQRDLVELPLTRWAAADGMPILGICRGIQVLNVALGGTLYQDIPAQLGSSIRHDDSYLREDWTHMAHELRLDPGSHLARLIGTDSFTTNSLHHQSVKDLAPGLRAVGWAPDGVVEAVEGDNGRFLLGVQCHPEALQGEADPRWAAIFRAFVESCVQLTIK
jgi:putative glutamine amidotransferase